MIPKKSSKSFDHDHLNELGRLYDIPRIGDEDDVVYRARIVKEFAKSKQEALAERGKRK